MPLESFPDLPRATAPDFGGSQLEHDQVIFLRQVPALVESAGMHGLSSVVNALVVALLTGGHVLLEGNPGLGKTALVKALSGALALGSGAVGRIQFTPDLMPADVTGTQMPSKEDQQRLAFVPGPVFCNLLLADEINRATAKTQSAMLEAMAEYQVTVLGETYPLRHWKSLGRGSFRTPFMVMATQNPIDQEGTYTLPEAQSDRFMFKIHMAMPGAGVLDKIIGKALEADVSPEAQRRNGLREPDAIDVTGSLARLHEIAEAVLSVPLPPAVRDHINNLVQASNGQFGELRGLSATRLQKLRPLVERILYPLGPRAAMAMARASVGWAAVALVDPAEAARATSGHTPRALAETVVPVLRHRLKIRHEYQDHETTQSEGAAIDAFVRALAVATAPDTAGGADYPADFAVAMERAQRDIRL